MEVTEFARRIPKAELHLHVEGTLEPELMFALAARNGVGLPFARVEDVRAAYDFADLQSFLDIYYQGAAVLVTAADFHDLALAYLTRAAAQGVRHAEVFFDPQTHTARGVAFDAVVEGLTGAAAEAEKALGITTSLIMCFLRHLSADDAMATLDMALPHADRIIGVGLDSSEVGNRPEKFAAVFDRARAAGFLPVAHAGEEGDPSYIWGALDALGAQRIDHGVRSLEDPQLVARLVAEQIPLTVCPLSNVRLKVVASMADHMLPAMLEAGLLVSINSDDPAYFGGYIGDNYCAAAEALDLDQETIAQIARNSFRSSFLSPTRQAELIAQVDRFAADNTTAGGM